MYDRGSEFIGHEFKNTLIQDEYGIPDRSKLLGITNSNAISDRINLVLGDLVHTYILQEDHVDTDEP